MNKIFTLLLLLNFSIGYCQSEFEFIDKKVDIKDLKRYIGVLSSDSLKGRLTGSKGQKKAAKFIENEFNRLNLQPYDNNSYMEKFSLNETYINETYMKVNQEILENFKDIIYIGEPINKPVQKKVVFGGYGTIKELTKIDIKDKLVVIFHNNLRGFNKSIEINLQEEGAFGVILVNPESDNQFKSMKSTLKDFHLKRRFYFGKKITKNKYSFLPRFIFSHNAIKRLFEKPMRKLISLSKKSNFSKIPIIDVEIKCERITEKVETENVIGIIKGVSKKSILISAHYDHLGIKGDKYYPGADDNASGISGLLEIAEVFTNRENKYNLIFLATSGEEVGLLGSYYHTTKKSFENENIILNINLDMISRTDEKHKKNDNYLYPIGTDINPKFLKIFKNVDNEYNNCYFDYSYDNSNDLSGFYSRSDQHNFYKKDIPSIMLFSGLHSDYHKTSDTADKIDYTLLEYRVEMINRVIDRVQKEM